MKEEKTLTALEVVNVGSNTMINFNRYEEDDYYLYPFAGNIEFKRKRKPMSAAVKKKISQALKTGRKRRKDKKISGSKVVRDGLASALGGGLSYGAYGTMTGFKERSLTGNVKQALKSGTRGAIVGSVAGGGLSVANQLSQPDRKYGYQMPGFDRSKRRK